MLARIAPVASRCALLLVTGPAPGLSFGHSERPSIEFGAVQAFDGLAGQLLGDHLDEPESPGFAGVRVIDHGGVGHGADLAQKALPKKRSRSVSVVR